MADSELDMAAVFADGSASTDAVGAGMLRDAIDLASDQNQGTWLTDGGKRIAKIVPVDEGEMAARAMTRGPYQDLPAGSLNTGEGHLLSRHQIARHGVDRYPDPQLQLNKLLSEVAELGSAIVLHGLDRCGCSTGASGCPRIRAEYADVGLSLYALGDKLGIDLIEAMTELVRQDTRRFGD